jgi:hypothetical protein
MKTAVNIRMPNAMKEALEKLAADEFRSLSSQIIKILDEYLRSIGVPYSEEAPPGRRPKKA